MILQECINSSLFLKFVKVLIEQRALVRGGIFVVDNCNIHMFGNNIGIQYALFNMHGVLMIELPPYHLECNPTDLMFNTLLQILSCERARYSSLDVNNFLDTIKKKWTDLLCMLLNSVINIVAIIINTINILFSILITIH